MKRSALRLWTELMIFGHATSGRRPWLAPRPVPALAFRVRSGNPRYHRRILLREGGRGPEGESFGDAR